MPLSNFVDSNKIAVSTWSIEALTNLQKNTTLKFMVQLKNVLKIKKLKNAEILLAPFVGQCSFWQYLFYGKCKDKFCYQKFHLDYPKSTR